MKKLFLSFLMVFLTGITVYSQVTTSGVSGTVADTNGEMLPGATVVAVHQPSGTQYGTVTNSEGRFNLQGMRPGGPYKVDISFVGYATSSVTDLTLNLGDNFTLNSVLKESDIALGEVVITAARAVEKTGTRTNVTSRQIQALPTISRSINDFTRLSPYAGGGNSFAGRDGRYNNITIDGAAFNNNFGLSSKNLPGGDAQPISLDAIDAISVNVSPFDIRVSNFTGASINAITKSGDNKLKVSAYTYQRPENFTGEKVGENIVPNARTSSQSTYGISIGAPIIKDKLFIFVNGEIESREYPGIEWSASKTDGSDANAEKKISRTTTADMKTVSDFLINNYNYNPGAYQDFGSFASENYKIMARLDWNINQNHKFTFRYNDVKSTNDQPVNSNSAPNPRGSARIGLKSMSFYNSNYNFTNYVRSFTGELNSKFSDIISNKFLASYTHIQDTRGSNSDFFPFVDIYKDKDQYMSLGYELFTYNNDVINNTLNFTDNVTFNLGNHMVTAGISFDRMYFMNSYLRYALSYYRYASMEDFMQDKAPIAFGLTYGYNNVEAPGAELTFGKGAIYIQDEFAVSENITLTGGFRFERPFYFDDPVGNKAILDLTFADGQKIDVSQWPEPKIDVQPRFGFNWDIKGDNSMTFRWGTGFFSGYLPFVWYTNQPTNSGVIQNTVEITNTATLAGFKFEEDYKTQMANHTDLFPSTPAEKAPGTINVVSPEFVLPKVWRSTIGYDVELPWNLTFTVEGMYSQDYQAIVQNNVNESAPLGNFSGTDNRSSWYNNIPATGFMAYSAAKKTNRINSGISNAMVLENTDEGYQYSLMAQITKKFTKGLMGTVAYTYSGAKDLTTNPGSSANSAWSSNTAVNSLNNPGLSYSGFTVPHRLIGSVSYRIEYVKHLASTFSLFYVGYNQGRMSYTYQNDMNGDGNTSDLMYIPKDKSDITFIDITGSAPITAQEQLDAFWNYLESDSYLSANKGKYAERFGKLEPWYNNIDFKFAQEIFTGIGESRRGTLEITLDILNVGNLLNSDWGSYKTFGITNGYDNIQLIKTAGFQNGAAVYQLNAASIDAFNSNAKFVDDVSTGSTWSMMLGVKFKF
ncbi:MAG TPA: carboxypeptidase regulatory-like domain-containing protein [Draconibacterium sp.]|nr:carboxypeptidase regulatory-like domain-containing protein [Draconibacterium sp.]